MKSEIIPKGKFYDEIKSWWESWNFPVIPLVSLPDFGIMISNEEKNICNAWLYETNSNILLLEWFVVNKKANKQERKDCFTYLVDYASNYAKLKNFNILFSSVKNQSLIKKLVDNGYNNGEKGMVNLTKII